MSDQEGVIGTPQPPEPETDITPEEADQTAGDMLESEGDDAADGTAVSPGGARDAQHSASIENAREEGDPLVWEKAFITAFANTGNVRAACAAVQIDRATAYRRRSRSTRFAEQWAAAKEEAADVLEAAAFQRATQGVDRPVYGRVGSGKEATTQQVGTVKEFSDLLLIFLLKGLRPEKYRERHEVRKVDDASVDAEIQRLSKELGVKPAPENNQARNS
jgi:hypothetical protein